MPNAHELTVALKRAIAALNVPRNFQTYEGIKSYDLIPQLEKVLKEHGTDSKQETNNQP